MNRLTKEQISNVIANTHFLIGGRIYGKTMFAKMVGELLEYKYIEDDLNIDLIAYHRLMEMLYCGGEDKIFVKNDDGTITETAGILEIDYCKKKFICYKDKNYNDDYVLGFGGYKDYWAFNKEDLNNDKR